MCDVCVCVCSSRGRKPTATNGSKPIIWISSDDAGVIGAGSIQISDLRLIPHSTPSQLNLPHVSFQITPYTLHAPMAEHNRNISLHPTPTPDLHRERLAVSSLLLQDKYWHMPPNLSPPRHMAWTRTGTCRLGTLWPTKN